MPTAKSRAKNQDGTQPDAIALLTEDHDTVRDLLSELEDTTDRAAKKRTELLEKIDLAVRVHSRIEEEIFYPAYKAAARTKEETKLFFEAAEEHALVDIVLLDLENADPTSEQFGAKAKVLKDLIEHHADEEESEMFPNARRLLGKSRLLELARQIESRKAELETELRGEVEEEVRKPAPARAARAASSRSASPEAR